jgi:YihY family inner membrane protein
MVAYNLLLSLLPLTLLALFIFGRVVQSADVQASVVRDVHRILPSVQGHDITHLLRDLRHSSTSLGIAALLSSIWVGSSFWGALDTAFCRIYHSECRSWLRQKRFALVMLLVVLAFFAATVALPALQSALVHGADRLPFGLNAQGTVYAISVAVDIVIVFAVLATVYRVVPNWAVPWRAVWPGALGATLAIAAIDYSFPLYLHESVLNSFGGTYVFVLIVLVWFYAVSLIILGGAVLNALRLRAERHELERDRSA